MIELALIHFDDIRLASLMVGMTAAAALFSNAAVVTAIIDDVLQYCPVFMAVDT